ncbi:unnamed protein product [Callosobruchus maculatus]|uniref:C2H2-type domain-containing protein n=1 Tax=Callosobruchus maculatus TaxID=64391 RepID=A0A653DJN3_CALMS|nr:unnamed protein product [Callosobruchus maculatus]
MDVCNLCLQDSYPLVNTDLSKRLSSCVKYSHLPKVLQHHSYACELCLENFTTFINFHDIVISTESKIKFLRNELSCKKIDLKSICDGANVLDKCQHCRVCLKPVKWLGIYLYKNDTNILDFTLLRKMFSFCNLILDYEATDHPILCRQCFERLQIIYNFKKMITEAFETANNCDESNEILEEDLNSVEGSEICLKIRNDLMPQDIDQSCNAKVNITNSDPKLQSDCVVAIEKLPNIMPNPVYLQTKKHKSRRKLTRADEKQDNVQASSEHHLPDNDALFDRINKQTHKGKRVRSYLGRMCKPKMSAQSHPTVKNKIQKVSVPPLPDAQGHSITDQVNSLTARKRTYTRTRTWNLGYSYTNDDLLLHKLYFKHTKLETEFPSGYWDIISKEWNELTHNNTSKRMLNKKLYWQISQRIIPQHVVDRIKGEVKTCLEVQQTQRNPPVESRQLDHDYQFTDSNDNLNDAVGYRNVPIKEEPVEPSDIDIEIWFPEPKTEPQSESEMEGFASPPELDTPPQLDRMDIPSPVSLKREAVRLCSIEHNYSILQMYTTKPKISPNPKTLDEEFRCTECFFTTRTTRSAKRHILSHQQGKVRIYECPSCTYRITSKLALKIHMRTHSKDQDYPVLTPWYQEGKQTLEEKRKKMSMATQT